MSRRADPATLRALLSSARLMLLFTPELVRGGDPRAVLEALLPEVDVVQVRPKAPGAGGAAQARAARDWCRLALELAAARGLELPILVDDRVDVALLLAGEGLAGVHLGQGDLPVAAARRLLGADALLGLSTHDAAQLARAEDEPVDYLGFGPVHATASKGYARGLGPERAWLAAAAAPRPLFAIGGIDASNVATLGPVGRVAVGAALLGANDPAAAARELRALLAEAAEELQSP